MFNPFAEDDDPSPADAELVELAKNGDLAALEKLVLRHQAWVYNMAVVSLKDQLRYSEPPDWFVPARRALGAVLLADQQATAAELVYREDLRRWPDNGWSLHGLARTLEALGHKEEARKVSDRFQQVWRRADVKIKSSCFCAER